MFVNRKLERDTTYVFPTYGIECPRIDERVKSIEKIGRKVLCKMLDGVQRGATKGPTRIASPLARIL